MKRLLILPLVLVLTGPLSPSAASGKARETVNRTLAQLEAKAGHEPGEVARWRGDWRAVRRAARRLRGEERRSIAGVIANTRSLAARRLLATRARPAFETVHHNLDWFVTRGAPAPANGTRDGFGSDVVWQFYAGSGWQLQPLGSFGALNALVKRRRTDERIRRLADDLLRLGVWRKSFLAFEYLFPWGGGRPGWISGMAQATGMQAFAGAYRRLGDPRLLRAATRMRPAFEHRPPWGVRRRTGRGRAHFLLYSQSPRLLVGNGFAQALLGLDRYREISGDPRAARLVAQGLAQARRNFPRFDTGAWSLYFRTPTAAGTESDLHYHRVFTGFLGQLCERFGEERFCRMSEHFVAYEREPVDIERLRLRKRRRHIDIALRVSKRSTVDVTVRVGRRIVGRSRRALLRGPDRFVFARPRSRKAIAVEVVATSLTGVRSTANLG